MPPGCEEAAVGFNCLVLPSPTRLQLSSHSAATHPGAGAHTGTTVCSGRMSISFPSGFHYFSVYTGQKAQDECLEEKKYIIFEKIENIYHCLGVGAQGPRKVPLLVLTPAWCLASPSWHTAGCLLDCDQPPPPQAPSGDFPLSLGALLLKFFFLKVSNCVTGKWS